MPVRSLTSEAEKKKKKNANKIIYFYWRQGHTRLCGPLQLMFWGRGYKAPIFYACVVLATALSGVLQAVLGLAEGRLPRKLRPSRRRVRVRVRAFPIY